MDEVKSELSAHIKQSSFPCVMAKAVEKIGRIEILELHDVTDERAVTAFHDSISNFIDAFRKEDKLGSFVLTCDKNHYADFEKFEKDFWGFLRSLRAFDRSLYPHDPRVSESPEADDFSFSIKSEAFFILLLHPDSPRWARRFTRPAIVFNPHVQFEKLRARGLFEKVRTLIRSRDKILQGTINPMLSDYGERSEIFQYTGRTYTPEEKVPLLN